MSGRNRAPMLPEHGFDAAELSAGSEVPLVTVVRAEPGRVSAPKYCALVVLCYDGICGAAHHVPAVLWHEHTEGIARSWSSGQAAPRACPVPPSCWAQLSSAVADAPAEVRAVPAGARVSVRGRHRLGP
ncbi:hypothetical protein GTW46_38820 [Streptomyces sp. SID6013]|nr:hypothetical protein [Streptomyces sp. SID6013]